MVTGFPPYHSDNRMELFESIVYKTVDVSKVTIGDLGVEVYAQTTRLVEEVAS